MMRRHQLVLVCFLAACARSRGISHPAPTSTWDLAGKAVPVTAPHAMVTTGHPLATEVGRRVLEQGGDAIDAAVAVGFALTAVLPAARNIGGGVFIVYLDTTGAVS